MAAYPPEITGPESERLTEVVKDWSIAHGLTVRPPPAVLAADADPGNILATAVPVTLFPSPFPRVCFEQGVHVQKTYNELYASISQDEEFLTQIVKEIGNSDEFTQALWKVHLRVKEEGYVQNLSLGLFRSDYMVHQESASSHPQVKQVEFNTIAASFGGLSAQTSQLHKYLSSAEYPLLSASSIGKGHLTLPDNKSVRGLAAGIRHAFTAYGESTTGHPKCVVFLVQGGERNIFDQKHLEYEVAGPPQSVPVFRLPFAQATQHTRLADGGPGRQLLYTPPQLPHLTFEVAVVYMRCGYGPDDYPDAGAWEARYQIERSAAIKCPSVLTQVAGTKKVQQVLATPVGAGQAPVLHRFLSPASHAALGDLEATFTNIYPLDTSAAGRKARELALDPEQCKRYVLKPQREGGGNNVYRAAIPGFLRSIPESHWDAHILMELITPPAVRNTILRNGALESGGVICELGIYGTCLWDQREREGRGVRHNEMAGYLLRTKGDQSEEGGVAAGFGCMDSIALV
ncbi:hypothetical protein JX265_002304 [Neoarthrinium moseri]|uniref:Glutathione synthetase n=1 Tax=Neoarthrinium moseri TaxID=1658444 RepID=A0A9P9WUB3_9PEZI|nr:uncharacterized protein JN550_000116 [Neoarthrinium moseri]KAI1877934.1 hypothetical protein JN550_000116 [Neoarthrinium moseri]KAI1879350.1 hypothetical protein JX265_002304 [Neoarthrinium moseri]